MPDWNVNDGLLTVHRNNDKLGGNSCFGDAFTLKYITNEEADGGRTVYEGYIEPEYVGCFL